MWDQNPNNAQRTTQGSHITHLTKKEKPNTQDINWKRKSIFIEWRINQIKLHTAFSLNTKPTLVMPKKKKSITFTVPNTPICPEKKNKKNYQRKVKQLNKTQMRKLKKVHIFKNPRWEFTLSDSILLSHRAKTQQEERGRERKRAVRKRSLLGMIDRFDFEEERNIIYLYFFRHWNIFLDKFQICIIIFFFNGN